VPTAYRGRAGGAAVRFAKTAHKRKRSSGDARSRDKTRIRVSQRYDSQSRQRHHQYDRADDAL